jgi:hypothetical protein
MEFGTLTTPDKMEKYFNQMRLVSRAELINAIYKNSEKPEESRMEYEIS